MIPACLLYTTGLRGCAPTAGPAPLAFLDDLPGWSFALIAGVANADTPSAYAYADRLIANAQDIVINDMRLKLAGQFTLRDAIEYILPEPWQPTTSTPTALRRGIQIQKKRNCGKLSCLKIESVAIAIADDLPTLTIQVEAGSQTTYYTVEDIEAFQPFEVPIDFTSNADLIRITLPETVTPLTIRQPGQYCGCQRDETRCWSVHGWDGVSRGKVFFGIQIRGAAGCCTDELYCLWKSQFADLVKWRAGMLLAMEGHVTSRINEHTLNQEKLSILHDNWAAEYEARMKVWADSARLSIAALKEPCITCNRINYSYGH